MQGVPRKLFQFFKFLTYERYVYSNHSGDFPRKIYKGVLQGGSSSVISYIFYVSSILKNVSSKVSVLQFADDIVLYTKTSDLESSIEILEKAIATVSANLYELGLELAPHKTEVIHYNKRNILPQQISLKIKNTIVKSTDQARFLGLYFDYQLNFDNQNKGQETVLDQLT